MSVLLGEWGFLGDLRDTSGYGRHGTLGRAVGSIVTPPSYVAGPQAGTQAIQWGEPDQYVDVGATGLEPATEGYATMAWVKSPSVSGAFSGVFARGRGGSSTRGGLQVTDTGLIFYMCRWVSRLDFGNGPSVADNAWHHVATVDNDDRSAVFVDGVKIHESLTAATGSPTWEPGFTWHVGATVNLCTSFAGQAISGVRFFSGKLTDSDVTTWMNRPVLPSRVKVWDGSAWIPRPLLRWDGTQWQPKPPQVWTGSAWST